MYCKAISEMSIQLDFTRGRVGTSHVVKGICGQGTRTSVRPAALGSRRGECIAHCHLIVI